MASLDNSEEKIAFRDSNNILDGNTISYDLAYENTMLFFGKVNMLLMAILKKDKFNGTLIIHIPGEPENSGTLYDMNEKGQGTSSMLYWWWNGQWGFNEDGYWLMRMEQIVVNVIS